MEINYNVVKVEYKSIIGKDDFSEENETEQSETSEIEDLKSSKSSTKSKSSKKSKSWIKFCCKFSMVISVQRYKLAH